MKKPSLQKKKIGIFSGTFDPIHNGHIAFAEYSIQEHGLYAVYFLIEENPRHKSGVSPKVHREAMLALATKDKPNLKILDLLDPKFSVAKTLPKIQKLFPDEQLFLLLGDDVFKYMQSWPDINRLQNTMGIIVGERSKFSGIRAQSIRKSILETGFSDQLSARVLDYILSNKLYR